MALGLFVALFGINQLILFSGTVTYVVGIFFILIGTAVYGWDSATINMSYPYAQREAEELNQ